VVEEFFFDGVPVEPRHRGQAASDGGPGPAEGFQVPGEKLDIGAAGLEEAQLVLLGTTWRTGASPAHTLAASGRVSGEEPG
jgi:hypothetical protein